MDYSVSTGPEVTLVLEMNQAEARALMNIMASLYTGDNDPGKDVYRRVADTICDALEEADVSTIVADPFEIRGCDEVYLVEQTDAEVLAEEVQ